MINRGQNPYIPMAAVLAARAALIVVLAVFSPRNCIAGDDVAGIRTLIGKTWDQPEARVISDPIIVEGKYAIASWTQGDRGGRALLRNGEGGWRVILCSGDQLASADAIASAGAPQMIADKIAARLKAAEAGVSEQRRALFSTFEGTMRVDDTPTAHHGHSAQEIKK